MTAWPCETSPIFILSCSKTTDGMNARYQNDEGKKQQSPSPADFDPCNGPLRRYQISATPSKVQNPLQHKTRPRIRYHLSKTAQSQADHPTSQQHLNAAHLQSPSAPHPTSTFYKVPPASVHSLPVRPHRYQPPA